MSLEVIESNHGSLYQFADSHLRCGVHYDEDQQHWRVCEWAPNARSISLVGDFNQWNESSHHLNKQADGTWLLMLEKAALKHGDLIKLHVHGADDTRRDRLPATIQRTVQNPDTHDFSGQVWIPESPYRWKYEYDPSVVKSPLIYEAHTGMAGEQKRVHSYLEFADNVIPRIADLGYNTIQLMAVQEHPYYGSFGYHVSNFFAVSSRFGTPGELKYLVDKAHSYGIAVIVDLVHSHAVKNLAEGLNEFDGTDYQYFHGGEKGNHPQWDSKCFDYSKEEVQRFLLSNIRWWLEEFHFDGFRFDGITSMLYEHHGSVDFDHYERYFGDGVDNDAVLYLQLATQLIQQIKPGALIVAEDMSGMPGLCRPHAEGGVGFTHRLAMGVPDYWIKLLKHVRDEEWNVESIWSTLSNRRHGEANIAYAESHDQALVGDKTLAFWLMDQDMYWHMSCGDNHPVIDRGMALHKLIRLLTLTIGGEGYLNFMGNEFGHPEWLDFPREGNEWSFDYCRRQWSLVDNEGLKYRRLNHFDKAMIQLASEHNLLQYGPAEQVWINDGDHLLAYRRAGLFFIVNLHPIDNFENYHIPVGNAGAYHCVLNSDLREFGGHKEDSSSLICETFDGALGATLSIDIPHRSALVFALV